MKEALCIQAKPANVRFNRDSGYELPDCWIALNKKIERGGALVGTPAPGTRTTLRNYPPKTVKNHAFCAAYKSSESRDYFHSHPEDG